jgi:hypothetical protein
MEGHLTYPLPAGEERGRGNAAPAIRLNHDRGFGILPFQRLLQAMALSGVITLALGAFASPQRTWGNLLLAGNYVLGLSLAGLVFVALHYTCAASWSTAFRRVPEAMAAMLPWAAAPFVLIFAVSPWLYPWFEDRHGGQPTMWFKELWLSPAFFFTRSAIYLAVWIAFGRAIVRVSRRQDEDGGEQHTRKNARLSAAFLVVFGFTFWLASYDWIMSLEPHWYSTMFGVYQFAGLLLSGLAMITILVIWLEKRGPLQGVLTEEHLHDLGKLLFAFSTFWMYIWFCQYMLIWYANIPEETAHYVHRLHGFWEPVFLLNFLLNWAVPFLVLLHVPAKRSRSMLLKICWVILVGRWVDLYLLILPPIVGEQPVFGVWEIGLMLGAAGLFFLALLHVLPKANPVPINDPFLSESLTYHN